MPADKDYGLHTLPNKVLKEMVAAKKKQDPSVNCLYEQILESKLRKGYNGWMLDLADRGKLAKLFKPKYEKFIGHHVTFKFGVTSVDPLPVSGTYTIVGYADSSDGIEALVVAIDGDPNREDGSLYHITWSLNSKYKPKDSNALVQKGYEQVSPIPINLKPKFFPFK